MPDVPASPTQRRYAFGPFVLDTARRRLLRDDSPVAITARVYDILAVLVEHQGRPVEKDTLIGRVWGNVAVEEGNLARHVSTLRKVLGESPNDHHYIITLPGRGYQFVAPVSFEAVTDPSVGQVEPADTPAGRVARIRASAIAAVMLAAVGGIAYALITWRTPAQTSDVRRIVVLPFKNLGGAADESVAGGIAEEIANRLASAQGLQVVSDTTAASYENSAKTVSQIGAGLGAGYLLEGSVLWDRRAATADRVRITAQLIDVERDARVWTETFDRELQDLFAVQAEIAVRIARATRGTLIATEPNLASTRSTHDPEAYRSYLQGVFYASRPDYSDEGLAEAIRHFQHAADLDSRFAQAYAALARAHLTFHQFGHDTSAGRVELARRALERAQALAPHLPDTSRAEMRFWLTVRPDAIKALAAAAATERQRPNDAAVYQDSAALLLRLGRWNDAAAKLQQWRTLDPRNALVHAQLGLVLTGLRRYADAQQAIDQSLALERDQQVAHVTQVWALWLSKGDLTAARALIDALPKPDDWRFMELRWLQSLYERRFDQAAHVAAPWAGRWMRTWVLVRPADLLEAQARRLAGDAQGATAAFESARHLLETALTAAPDDGRLRSSVAIAYAGLGRRADALREAQRALALMPYPNAFDTAVVREDAALAAAMAGDLDMAFAELDTLLTTAAHFSLHTLRLDPRWDALRSEARYRVLIARGPS